MAANNVVHIFRNVSMAYQHDGLEKIARKAKVVLHALEQGQHVLFINSPMTRIKMYSPGGVISYFRAPENTRVNLNMIEFIPRCFSARGGMNWSKAEAFALEKLLAGPVERATAGELYEDYKKA